VSHKASFIADQRGAVALETLIVIFFMIVSLLLPLADLAIAGFNFMSAHQALRDMGQRVQFRPPADVSPAGITAWQTSLPATVDGYTVSAQVYCGNPVATCTDATFPKYYTFTTTFDLSPFILPPSVLCRTCTVTYSQPFQ
jgi:hypothetical protein